MIDLTLITTPDALCPFSRGIQRLEVAEGSRVRDVLPDGWGDGPGETLVFVGATRVEDWDRELEGGDVVHFVGGVTDPVTVFLVAIAIVSAVVAVSMMPEVPTTAPDPNPDGSSAYGYYGFQNSFRAEGDPIPIVYGRMRTAPPVINQVIVSNSVAQVLSLAVREDMFVLLAISEGPIYGLGIYEGKVENKEDQDELVGFQGSTAAVPGTGLQINGIGGENFYSAIQWRTGTLEQEALTGSQGFVTYTDTSVTYVLDVKPLNGQTGTIDDSTFPPGVFANGSSSLLSNVNESEYAEQDIAVESDSAVIQINFERGLYSQNTSGGFNSQTKTIRVQYRRTDSGGVGVGDWILMPSYKVTSSQTTPQLVDIPIEFTSTDSFTAPTASNGYYRGDSDNSFYLRNLSSTGNALRRPSNFAAYTQQWTMGCWFHPQDMTGGDGTNKWLFYMDAGSSTPIDNTAGDSFFRGPVPGGLSSSERFFAASIRVDSSNVKGAGSDAVYAVLEFKNSSTGADRYARLFAFIGRRDDFQPTTGSPEGRWTHITFKYDGAAVGGPQCRCYVNGIVSYTMQFEEEFQFSSSGMTLNTCFPDWPTNRHTIAIFGTDTGSNFTESKCNLCEWYLYDGLLDEGKINLIGNEFLGNDIFGHKTNGIRSVLSSDPSTLSLITMDELEAASGISYYRDYVNSPTGTVAESTGSFRVFLTANHRDSGGPIWEPFGGTAVKSFYKVQVFVSAQTQTNTSTNTATISSLTALSSQPYRYPATAIASVNVEADEQVNNQQPSVTMLVKGKLVNTWDGSVDEQGNPALAEAWSRNPAWIAADLLVNERYGLGSELTPDAIDWPSFLSWAQFCDEGVPDAFGNVTIFGIKAEGSSVVPTEELVTIYVGTVASGSETTASIPQSWQLPPTILEESEAFVSIISTATDGISSEWVTSNDNAVGLNSASNQLGIYSISFEQDTSGFHGFTEYAIVKLRWNRLNAEGQAVWPTGVSGGDSFFADDLGITDGVLATTSGYEARCMFDGVFDQIDQGGWEAVLQVFAAGRAMPIKAGRKIIATVDRIKPVVGVFGQGNIIDGTLELTYTGPKQRPNSVEGDILDEDSNYEKRTISVDHSSIQDPTTGDAYRKERAEFRGVVRRSQALRDATYRLNRYFLTRRHIKFDVGPDAVNLLPGDRILVSHDVPQYGFSGRVRADQATTNIYPNAGDFYASWDAQGGPNALSLGGFLSHNASVGDPITVGYDATLMRSFPTNAAVTGPAASNGQSGSDASSAKSVPWAVQLVATGSQLYPPNPTFGPLAQIDASDYQCAFAVYVKENPKGSAKYLRLNVYRFVDEDGTIVGDSRYADFTWTSGAPVAGTTSSGITASVTSVGSGWYRLGVVFDNSTVGASVGEYLQARAYMNTGAHSVGFFSKVAEGGKGINFLEWGDPLDCTKSSWTRYNHGTSSVVIENSASVADPFYSKTDGTYGSVVRLFKPGAIAFGTTPPNLVQAHALETGTGVANWNNETITVSGYARVGSGNGASNTTMYVDLKTSASVDSNNKLNGDGVRQIFSTSAGGGSWSVSTATKTEGSGTVNSNSADVAAVYHTSTTNDADWVEFSVSMAYTPTSGNLTNVYLGIHTDSGGSGSGGDTELNVWGLRLHGKSSSGTAVSPYFHKAANWHAAQFLPGSSSIPTFGTGASIELDRDVTLENGKTYEVLLRSSFEPNPVTGADNSEVVTVDASEIPASGSTTKSAGTALKISTPEKFVVHEGDLFSFGQSAKTSEDFVIQRISLDPATLHRTIEADEYNEAIYDDTAFGTTGLETVSDVPSDDSQALAASQQGVGISTAGAMPFSGFQIDVDEDEISDEMGNFMPRLLVRWTWPRGIRTPRAVNIYFAKEVTAATRFGANDAPTYVATVQSKAGRYEFAHPTLLRGQRYRIYVQPVGSQGSATPVLASPSKTVLVRKVPRPYTLTPPAVSTVTRGWQQLYELERIQSSRTVDVVEGRIGGWKLGSPAFIIDPDVSNVASDSTLVGQASTATGRTEMRVFCRSRTTGGHYGQASVVTGSEQLADLDYTDSTSTENNYTTKGVVSTEMEIDSGDLHFKSSSTALSAQYVPTEINLGSAQRVLVNCVAEAIQVRPETLADMEYRLDDEYVRRWSFEGPMDELDGDDAEIQIDWRWTSASSFTTETFRKFRPGEVYARRVQFRLTFVRPTASYDIRMSRCVVQALLPPNFAPADVDGGTFS